MPLSCPPKPCPSPPASTALLIRYNLEIPWVWEIPALSGLGPGDVIFWSYLKHLLTFLLDVYVLYLNITEL